MYDNALGRFFGVDLLADLFVDQSPYHFGYNNPISFIDPTGLAAGKGDELDEIIIYVPAPIVPQVPGFGTRPPYFGNIFDIGKIGIYDPNNPFPEEVLPEMIIDKQKEAKNGVDFNDASNSLTVGGVIYDELGNTIANKNFWIDAKGNYKSTDILNKQANGKYVRGVQGYRNGYKSALKTAGKYQAAGRVVGALGIGITIYEIGSGQKNLIGEGGLDLIMGGIGFTGWGAPVSLIYFGGKYILQVTNNDFWNK